jgi:hypothetical protein
MSRQLALRANNNPKNEFLFNEHLQKLLFLDFYLFKQCMTFEIHHLDKVGVLVHVVGKYITSKSKVGETKFFVLFVSLEHTTKCQYKYCCHNCYVCSTHHLLMLELKIYEMME